MTNDVQSYDESIYVLFINSPLSLNDILLSISVFDFSPFP